MKEVSSAHQNCIYLIKNTVKYCEILVQFIISVFYTLENKGASRCHRRTFFLSKRFHKEPLTSFLFHNNVFVAFFRLYKVKKEMNL